MAGSEALDAPGLRFESGHGSDGGRPRPDSIGISSSLPTTIGDAQGPCPQEWPFTRKVTFVVTQGPKGYQADQVQAA